MVERIDELTGLPTTRTGVVPRKEGELGPGAEWDGYCIQHNPEYTSCTCGGSWQLWWDHGRRTMIFRHIPVEESGKVYHRTFDWNRFAGERQIIDAIRQLTSHEVHPVNTPTPGRARR